MSDLNDRLEESGMPVRKYGNAATMFKKTVPIYANITSINAIKNDKEATKMYEKVKIEFEEYNAKFKKDLEKWSKKYPELAAEAAKRNALSKERRLEQNRRKQNNSTAKPTTALSEDSDNVDSHSVDSDDELAQPTRKKHKAAKAEVKKERKSKAAACASDDSDDERVYRGSYAKLIDDVDGDEMKEMVKVVSAFKDETLRMNAQVKAYETRFTELEKEAKTLGKKVAVYNKLVEEVFLKLDEAAYPILRRRKTRNSLQHAAINDEDVEE